MHSMFANKYFRDHHLFGYVAVAIFAAAIGSGLVASSALNFKWFLVVSMGTLVLISALFFEDVRLFGVWLFTGSVSIAVNYKILKQPNERVFIDHFGGAAADPMFVSLVDFAILPLLLIWVVDLGANGRWLPKWTRLDSAILVFILLSGLSIFNTREYGLLIAELCRYLKYFLVFWILRTYINRPVYVWGIFGIGFLVLFLQSVVAFLQYFLYYNLPLTVGGVTETGFMLVGTELLQRVTGLVGHSNAFASYLIIPLSAGSILFFADISRKFKLAILPFYLLGGVTLVLTFSRNGWMTFAFCTLLVGWLAVIKGRLKKMSVGMAVATLISICGLVYGFGLHNDLAGLMGRSATSGIQGVIRSAVTRVLEDDGKAYDSRRDLLGVAGAMIQECPVFGTGLNSFEETMISYDTTGITNVIQQPVHNIYFLVAAETGIPTLISFLYIGGWLVRRSWVLCRRDSEMSFVVGAYGLTSFVGLALFNMFDLSLRKEPIIGMVVLAAALVMAVSSIDLDPPCPVDSKS